MQILVLIGLLFACVATGLPAEKETSNDIFTQLDYEKFENSVAYVYDDNENLVRLTFEDDEDDESFDETKKDLANRVFFFLYTKDNPTDPKPLYLDDENALKNSFFDPKKPTRFITHGWMNSRNSAACTLIRDAYVKHDDYNVIVIDWSKISIRPYIWASTRVKMVGMFVSSMIDFLVKHGLDLSQTTLIGHSLGAHVSGLAARFAKGDVNYVVGLDPALPGFYLAGPGSRISSGDATYVEIIHTNGGLLGFLAAIGDVDFFPNGGSKQLGCLIDIGGSCSHARSYRFYAESILSDVGFHGRKCNSFLRWQLGLCKKEHTSIMGGHKLFNGHGNYFLMTRSAFPFAKGLLARDP
ncbi:hypothetical protein DMN91_000433 [Ooceraea biroi]|uniref:phospholipase A1 n=1 Tax=Ooceraea biroi TaxID=2015173 RepID=A0A026WXN2_OOCBI|nr:pancreatic triacylglycerol lipase [Ooceraea biroi]EZA59904.1 Pancreatic lipase-related protein [Ooceraea biroi]RLU26637.1 hypothetical protein DMN91_000433 [Ooceraea biroi]